jgi:hypothetical protein
VLDQLRVVNPQVVQNQEYLPAHLRLTPQSRMEPPLPAQITGNLICVGAAFEMRFWFPCSFQRMLLRDAP